jgi:polyisoprenoid-binding protein YceI
MIALRRVHLGERLQDGEVVVLGDVRLLRGVDERADRIVEVTALHRAASAFSKLVQIVEHFVPRRILAPIALVVAAVGCGTATQRAAVAPVKSGQFTPPSPLPATPAAKDYEVDTKRSRFEVWGTDLFSGDHRITFERWRAHVTTGDVITIDAEVDVTTASVDLPSANGLVRRDLLEADTYPRATLHATMTSTGRKPNEVRVAGTTELHGVTKELSFTGLLRQAGADYRFNAAFVLDRQTFGIHYGPVEPFLKDDVRLVIDVVAVPAVTQGLTPLESAERSSVPDPRAAPDAASPAPSEPQ